MGRAIFNKTTNLKTQLNNMASNLRTTSNASTALQSLSRNDYQVAPPRSMPPSNILPPQKYQPLANAQEVAAANVFPLASSITVQQASATGSGAAAIRVYVFNTARLNTTTNNGSGAASVTSTYSDGFLGAVVDDVLAFSRQGVGAICFGVGLRMVTTSSGAGAPASLAVANPRFDMYNMLGSSIPTNFNITADQTRSDYDNSIEVMSCIQNVNRFTQFSYVLGVGITATLTFNFNPNFKQ